MSLKKRKPDFQNPAFVLRLKFLFIDNLECLMIGFNDVYSCGEKVRRNHSMHASAPKALSLQRSFRSG